ncbi:unnamed protein product [Mytilus coruscus]|uniref:Uncharacterized protein n=1 Tax=Mytilus coruscus TaxID=42192 RepID=A0A6J8E0K7_MYTCO|nr:unnamed protein product [Mytilus coruscus]
MFLRWRLLLCRHQIDPGQRNEGVLGHNRNELICPDNIIMSSSNNNLHTSPSANDIAEALSAKLHSSGIQLVKDNNVIPTSETSAILNPSSQTGHASSAQSMQIPSITSIPPLATIQHDNSDDHGSSLALFQPSLSSDPDVIPGEQFHSSSANVDTPPMHALC